MNGKQIRHMLKLQVNEEGVGTNARLGHNSPCFYFQSRLIFQAASCAMVAFHWFQSPDPAVPFHHSCGRVVGGLSLKGTPETIYLYIYICILCNYILFNAS